MSEIIENNQIEDESALDAEIEASIEAVKAGQTPTPTPTVDTAKTEPEKPAEETPKADPEPTQPVEEDGDPQPKDPQDGSEIRIPKKGKDESDAAYEKRVELFDLVQKRKAATTPEAKEALSKKVNTARREYGRISSGDKITQPQTGQPTQEEIDADPNLMADKERLKLLGGATREDVEQIMHEQWTQQNIRETLDKFVDGATELQDPDTLAVFFDFVDENYAWQGKTGKELLTVLELARESMFKPAETIQERVIKGANVAEKVNAMQFPGGTTTQSTLSPEMRKSVEEMKAAGMSEADAIELITD